jgi:hypothetical protein
MLTTIPLVTLEGYCVHSTVVPAIVPKSFLRQVRKSMGRNYCCPMVGGAMEIGESEAHDRRKFRIHCDGFGGGHIGTGWEAER